MTDRDKALRRLGLPPTPPEKSPEGEIEIPVGPQMFFGKPAFTRADDPVNHPKHYTSHPSGVECIDVTEHMGFNLGNAMKYIWRADEKGKAIEDLEKAAWYINREIQRRKNAKCD